MLDEALVLRKELKRTHLIQRLHAPQQVNILGVGMDNPFSFGGGLRNGGIAPEAMDLLREIFSFDYMGSAEFEWGAVPNALKFLAEQSSEKNLIAFKIIFGKNEEVYYVCPISYEEEVRKRIGLLRAGCRSIDLKEHCGLKEFFDKNDERRSVWAKKNKGWLELDNGFAFFVDKDMFEKFCKLIGVDTERQS